MRYRLPVVVAILFLFLLYVVGFAHDNTPTDDTIPSSDNIYLPFVTHSVPAPTPTSTHPHGDVDPPHIVTWSLSPTSINTENSDQVITFTIHVTDDLSGLSKGGGAIQARFHAPSSQQAVDLAFASPYDLISGTAQDGVYQSNITLKRFCETGEWKMEFLYLQDEVGNSVSFDIADVAALGLPVSFQVTN